MYVHNVHIVDLVCKPCTVMSMPSTSVKQPPAAKGNYYYKTGTCTCICSYLQLCIRACMLYYSIVLNCSNVTYYIQDYMYQSVHVLCMDGLHGNKWCGNVNFKVCMTNSFMCTFLDKMYSLLGCYLMLKVL